LLLGPDGRADSGLAHQVLEVAAQCLDLDGSLASHAVGRAHAAVPLVPLLAPQEMAEQGSDQPLGDAVQQADQVGVAFGVDPGRRGLLVGRGHPARLTGHDRRPDPLDAFGEGGRARDQARPGRFHGGGVAVDGFGTFARRRSREPGTGDGRDGGSLADPHGPRLLSRR